MLVTKGSLTYEVISNSFFSFPCKTSQTIWFLFYRLFSMSSHSCIIRKAEKRNHYLTWSRKLPGIHGAGMRDARQTGTKSNFVIILK